MPLVGATAGPGLHRHLAAAHGAGGVHQDPAPGERRSGTSSPPEQRGTSPRAAGEVRATDVRLAVRRPGTVIVILVVAAVLLFIFRFFYAGEVGFAQSLAICSWSMFAVSLVTTPLTLVVMALKEDWNLNPQEALQANPGAPAGQGRDGEAALGARHEPRSRLLLADLPSRLGVRRRLQEGHRLGPLGGRDPLGDHHRDQGRLDRNLLSAGAYTAHMKSVADELRDHSRRELERLSPTERIELALRLGDRDLDLFCRAQGLSREEGRRRLRAQRQQGRTPSVANQP